MPSSELSDALNPYIAQARPRHSTGSAYSTPALQPAQPYIPHRSELELAISEPAPRSRPNPSPGAVNAVQELVTLVASTRQAHEIERTRRLAWEKEQEAKYIQRQAEMERQMLEMRNEIMNLRALFNVNPSPLFTPHNGSPAITNLAHPRPASPISPISRSPSHSHQSMFHASTNLHNPASAQHRAATPSDSETPSSLPQTLRKRRRSAVSSDDGSASASDSSSGSRSAQRRTDHHDKRLLTIQVAMRAHILLMMDLPDKRLPDSHTEGEALEPTQPVRFVWDKTTKQSAHNGRMKLRILEDLKARRRLYKHVPDKDFNKKVVDAAFEQSFTTFRQKFKTQRDALAASNFRKREDLKARKSRHVARRKNKLSNRADARIKLNTFEHVTFDGAMQIECMSSEESDVADPTAVPRPSGSLRTRGYAWRSSRLLEFYAALDIEEKADASGRPKRGVGRRERFMGPPKEGFHLPPKGVASWMLSKRWLSSVQAEHPDLPNLLNNIVVDPPGFDWTRFFELGPETDESEDEQDMGPPHDSLPLQVHHYSASSLQCALT
ncbi:hypothetical protein B0H10DRAFT_1777225 [Mycena sp. CBHHK59/15]|nr:hypothetical protein B0H10DRAFT_1777225 [Mycena sp. CBHHK59/15]